MNINLESLGLRVKGRSAKAPAVAHVRDLVPADLSVLATERGVKPQAIKRIRAQHHALARALASGLNDAECSAITGYCLSRISILKNDPTFQELLSFYRDEAVKHFGDFHERLANIARMAGEELAERLEENPDSFENEELRKLIETTADRAGYAPQKAAKELNVSFNVNIAGRLQAARERLARAIDILPAPEEPVDE